MPGTVTAKVVERFVPIVRAAFAGAVMEITTRGLSQTIAAVVAPPVAPASPPASEAHSESGEATGDLKVVASAEELDLFERVTKIVAQSPAKHAIAHKDNATYFAVNLGRVQRWFLRFYGHGGTKFVVLRASQDALRPALNGFAAKAMSAQETRIDIASGADVDRIAAAVLVAYETEMKRKDTDAGAESP